MRTHILFSVCALAFLMNQAQADSCPRVGSNNGCVPNWGDKTTVSSISGAFGQAGGYYFNFAKFADHSCENVTGGSPQLMVPGSDPNAVQKMQAMKATLMSAAAAGSLVRVHWTSNYCWIDDILLCGDETCAAP